MRQHAMNCSIQELEESPAWKLLINRRSVPNIVALLMRTATIGGAIHLREMRQQANLLIEPKVESIGMLDWHCWEQAAEAGYRQTIEQLEKAPPGAFLKNAAWGP